MIKHISWQDLHVTVGHQNKSSQFVRQISVLFKPLPTLSANSQVGFQEQKEVATTMTEQSSVSDTDYIN